VNPDNRVRYSDFRGRIVSTTHAPLANKKPTSDGSGKRLQHAQRNGRPQEAPPSLPAVVSGWDDLGPPHRRMAPVFRVHPRRNQAFQKGMDLGAGTHGARLIVANSSQPSRRWFLDRRQPPARNEEQ